jgi:transaldolase
MKLFLDTANISAIREWNQTALINGVTTNPTHLSKERGDPTIVVEEIAALIPHGVVSVEITTQDPSAVYEQAHRIAEIGPNIAVKIPCHSMYYAVIKKLVDEGLVLNITLVFSVTQALCMAKLGVAYVSPFVGRLDDAGISGIAVLQDIITSLNNYPTLRASTRVLAASLRSVEHVRAALCAGVDALTLPVELLKKVTDHALTSKGMVQFDEDWRALHVQQFPSFKS